MVYSVQEKFWLGSFGNKYINRNKNKELIINKFFFFKKIFKKFKKKKITSVIEFGSNIGLNLLNLKKIFKLKKISAIEINKKAAQQCKNIKNVNIFNMSVNNFIPKRKYDLVLTCGFLIHQNPNNLKNIYKKIHDSCKNKGYVLIAEYFSSNPTKVIYRRKKDMLFKRDFAGEFVSIFKKSRIIDYGFFYHKDKYPQDDITWFLIKKNA